MARELPQIKQETKDKSVVYTIDLKLKQFRGLGTLNDGTMFMQFYDFDSDEGADIIDYIKSNDMRLYSEIMSSYLS